MRMPLRRVRSLRIRDGALAAFLLISAASQTSLAGGRGDSNSGGTFGPDPVAPRTPLASAVGVRPISSHPISAELWVWTFADATSLVQRAQQSGLSVLLVWVSPGFSTNAPTLAGLRILVADARRTGLAVHALGGDPSWAVHPQRAAAWAQEAASSGLFTGLHLDIEPNSLPSWASAQAALSRGLLQALDQAREPGMVLEADIPAWYHTVSVDGLPLDQAVLARVDGIAIMAYRNTAAGVLNLAGPEVVDAGRAGRYAYIGINIAAPGPDGALTSYLGKPAAALQSDVAAITAQALIWPAYAGIAVHDSTFLASLDPGGQLTFGGAQ
jgi:hypothetical protein